MQIYDSLTKKIKEITPKEVLNFYSCGPTVYGKAHIGNLRSFIMADLLVRTLKTSGQNVRWVMNITDIDDKTIKSTVAQFGQTANVENLQQHTKQFTKTFLEDLDKVGVDIDSIEFINVTDVIPEIQEFIVKLIDLGFAYKAEDGSTYFSIEKYQEKFGNYGQLVGEKFLEGKNIGARVKVDEYDKDNLSDFALWKAWQEDTDAQIFWDHATLGKGRPGWHIECSAINYKAFDGQLIDIHTGGVDLIFPHHTNEIAQSLPLGPFVDTWVHFEHLLVDGKKMSKSLNNFYTLQDLEDKGFEGMDLRYLFLQSLYSTQSNFTWDAITAAKITRHKLSNSLLRLENYQLNPHFLANLNDNLNSPKAIAIMNEDKDNTLMYAQILGIALNDPNAEVPENIQELLNQRQLARDNKDFTQSDQLRQQIEAFGFELKDTPEGQKIQKK